MAKEGRIGKIIMHGITVPQHFSCSTIFTGPVKPAFGHEELPIISPQETNIHPMISDPERMHELYHLPSIPLPDAVSDPDTLYCPNALFNLYPCSPPRPPAHEQCMYTEESLLLEKTSGLYLASLAHIVPLPSSTQPPSMLTLHEKLCGGFREERVTHVWTATVDSQPVIAKIFDPLYFIDPYEGTDPFPLLDLSVSREAKAYRRPAPLQGIQVPRALCLAITFAGKPHRHVAGQDVRYLVPASTSPSLCLAHRTAIIDAAITIFSDILMEDCPVHCSVDADNVESVMIDFEGSELWDPDHEFYAKQTREREMCALREEYMEDWWYGKYGI
ncbi:hypothetical protein IW261DRAFT_1426416 [Armillaria novae-zelandiae]|uniref:Uncharacterized protein n=1 Tax=Armillaria novae-zelandiae TaxID=153914 RepID=A0AA39NL63_9AGAR|nr:hypothetical protein IW261DRAFT_1426416 [Armillaria novae-zelandiae]